MNTLVNLLGIIGGFCFAYCGVPAAYLAIKHGYTKTPAIVSWMICLGGIFMYSYLTLSHGFDTIITINYTVEVLSWAVVLKYNYFERVLWK
jgi:hypothetical protein